MVTSKCLVFHNSCCCLKSVEYSLSLYHYRSHFACDRVRARSWVRVCLYVKLYVTLTWLPAKLSYWVLQVVKSNHAAFMCGTKKRVNSPNADGTRWMWIWFSTAANMWKFLKYLYVIYSEWTKNQTYKQKNDRQRKTRKKNVQPKTNTN